MGKFCSLRKLRTCCGRKRTEREGLWLLGGIFTSTLLQPVSVQSVCDRISSQSQRGFVAVQKHAGPPAAVNGIETPGIVLRWRMDRIHIDYLQHRSSLELCFDFWCVRVRTPSNLRLHGLFKIFNNFWWSICPWGEGMINSSKLKMQNLLHQIFNEH